MLQKRYLDIQVKGFIEKKQFLNMKESFKIQCHIFLAYVT